MQRQTPQVNSNQDISSLETQPILKVEDLKIYFYTYRGIVKAVEGIDFEIQKGEIFGLVGETGCGKSTTALAVMRLIPWPGKIIDGKILLKGEDLLKKSDEGIRAIRGKRGSMIFQEPTKSLNPVFTIGDQIIEAIKINQDIDSDEAMTKAYDIMKVVGLADPERVAKQYPHELSGGMAQRVMIAMAFSSAPDLLIADEPTTALDVTIQAQILDLMKDLAQKIHTSIFLITHNLGVVAEICDRVAVMYAGKIVETAKVETIFREPVHPYTKSLIKAVPVFGATKKKLLETIPGMVPSLIDPPSGCRFHPRCRHTTEICRETEPEPTQLSQFHTVFCHHHVQ